ncbi:hypothetical protein GCM10009639_05110 [Kitasatospora putterlickiae]|uniref:Uncharacterized protein n=1 Tax=Kitasatospora putterlickiae TaxID=221725 RepID=A0ABN1XKJ2_9ACTN
MSYSVTLAIGAPMTDLRRVSVDELLGRVETALGTRRDRAALAERGTEASPSHALDRVRTQLGNLYRHTVRESTNPAVRGARDSIRELLAN